MDNFIGKDDEGIPRLYTVVDRIYGRNLNEILKLPDESKEELDSYYAGLINHFLDAYTKGSEFLLDALIEQIMYGHKYGEREDHFYLVDVDPLLGVYKKEKENFSDSSFSRRVREIISDMRVAETKFESPQKFFQARAAFERFVVEVLKYEPEAIGALDQLKKILEP